MPKESGIQRPKTKPARNGSAVRSKGARINALVRLPLPCILHQEHARAMESAGLHQPH
jgi:hypothetical protein